MESMVMVRHQTKLPKMSSTESESGSGSENGSQVSVDSNEEYSDNIRILHAGGESSLSHQAALTFKYDISEGLKTDFSKSTISTRSHPTITEAYNSIKDSERNACLIPFYNTLTGLYDETTDLLQKQQDFEPRSNNGSMGIKGEARIPIRHHLLVSETDYLRLKSIAPGEGDQDQMQLSDEQMRGIGRIYGDELVRIILFQLQIPKERGDYRKKREIRLLFVSKSFSLTSLFLSLSP